MSQIKISVIIPVYNEEKTILETVSEIKKVMNSVKMPYEIITVNDCSTDSSKNIIDKIDGIVKINHLSNKGYGASLKTGIKSAKGEWILITDADGTYPIKDIPLLVKHMDFDMVVGSRTGKNVKIPLLRRPAKKIINILANFMSGYKIPDLNSGFRLFKKDLAMEFFHLYPQKFSFTTTITLAFLTNDYSVKYVPIDYYKRQGKSTIKPIKDFVGFINLIIRIITYFNPFKIFFTLSILLFLIAFFIFLYTFFIVGKIADITIIIIILSSVQRFLFGLIADLIIKSRNK